MAAIREPTPCLLIVAAFSRYPDALQWAAEHLAGELGPIGLESIPYRFTQTDYYEAEMGTELRKCFWAFQNLVDPGRLPAIKIMTNKMEDELARQGRYAEARPLNLDPGLLSLGKFMLATTKDQAHRLYLRDGIFAEVTLRYQGGRFEPWTWTYADYREPYVHSFLLDAREYYRGQM